MRLTCPHCQFSKEIPADRLPEPSTRVSCPRCKEVFSLPAPVDAPQTQGLLCCPACHTEQQQTETCTSCGLIFAKYRPPMTEAVVTEQSGTSGLDALPKAGFWLRLVALMIDCFLVFIMQIVFSVLLMLLSGHGVHFQGEIFMLGQLFSWILSLFYWIFFTGYGGQTPGKMLLRIKVVVTDGTRLSYGKAFYREVVGKFISGIILGIGYLMAAFDDQKQSLHDRMAKTYVIKL